MRECLAAARNLEQLTLARAVGPKVLSQVVPEVALCLDSFPAKADALMATLGEISPPITHAALPEMGNISRDELATLVRFLHGLKEGPLNAKRRLELERYLRRAVPALSRAVAHFELLVDAVQAVPVVMTIEEFLSSAPELGPSQQHSLMPVAGDLKGLSVQIPPRLGLSCLAAWLGTFPPLDEAFGLLLVDHEEFVEFRPQSIVEARILHKVPHFQSAPQTRRTVQAALSIHGADSRGGSLLFRKPKAEGEESEVRS